MSDNLDSELKNWCIQAAPLIGLKPGEKTEDVKEKWNTFKELIEKNLKVSTLSPKAWEKQKTEIEEAIKTRDLNASDLTTLDPIQTLSDLGTKIVDRRAMMQRATKLGLNKTGGSVMGSLPDDDQRRALLSNLEDAQKAWLKIDTEVAELKEKHKYITAFAGLVEEQEKTKPDPEDFAKAVKAANIDDARSLVSDYRDWLTDLAALAEANRKMAQRDTDWGRQEAESRVGVCKLDLRLGQLQAQIKQRISDARANLEDKKDSEAKSDVDSDISQKCERAVPTALEEWTKSTLLLDKIYVGGKAVTELEDIVKLLNTIDTTITNLEDKPPPVVPTVVIDTNWPILVLDVQNRWQAFASEANARRRLNKRGPPCAPGLSDYLFGNYEQGQRVKIGNARYEVCYSETAKLSFHRPIPENLLIPGRPNVLSFIYHFK